MAHNVNLIAKAILALGAYSKLYAMRGETKLAAEYKDVALAYAKRWTDAAIEGDSSNSHFYSASLRHCVSALTFLFGSG